MLIANNRQSSASRGGVGGIGRGGDGTSEVGDRWGHTVGGEARRLLALRLRLDGSSAEEAAQKRRVSEGREPVVALVVGRVGGQGFRLLRLGEGRGRALQRAREER